MSKDDQHSSPTTTNAEVALPVPPSADIPVLAELNRILQSHEFCTSKRCVDFLRYIVERTLAGQQSELKERTIGIEVFGRSATYETNDDAVVRIKASEVRKRLGLYYAGSGKDAPIRIELPVGGYVPAFSRVPTPGTGEKASQGLVASPLRVLRLFVRGQKQSTAPETSHVKTLRLVVAAAISIFALLAIARFWVFRPHTVLERFWAPVLRSPGSVLIVAAYAPVFVPPDPVRSAVPPTAGSYVLLSDQYVGGGDLIATARISGMLSRNGRGYEVRLGKTVPFEELRNAPTILIGYSSTQWAALSKEFRFFIDDTNQGNITDNGKATQWYPHHLTQDFHTDEDYAIISRAFDPQTHAMLVLVSGCTQYGTEAAAELVTREDLLSEALRNAPRDWPQKNLQLVLYMKVIADSPASPRVIAEHYW